MLAETSTEAFHINSLFVDSRQIVERTNGPKVNHVISKKECQELYPHHDGADGVSFYELVVRFHDRHFAEKLICLCDFDFSLALRLGTLCHGNIFFLKRLCVLFSNDLSSALRFLNRFPSSLSSSSSFLLSSQFLSCFGNDVSSASSFLSHFDDNGSSASSFLSHFHKNVSSASSFLSLFHDNGSSASSFLSHFDNDVSSASSFLSLFHNNVSSASSFLSLFHNNVSSASSFLTRFNNNLAQANAALDQKTPSKFSDESSFELALCGCNGDISAVEAFSRLSGIKHLELLFDSELHPRTAQEFHSRCDGRGATVSFVCASGNCVCGVVNSSWSSSADRQWVSDSSAFLLQLSPNPRKFPIKSDQTADALRCLSKYGPSFGSGVDFGSAFTSNNEKFPKGMGGWVYSGQSYDLPKNDFLFPTTDGLCYPIDRVVVCKFTQ